MERSQILLSGIFFLAIVGPVRSEWFIRGDANSSGSTNIADAIQVLQSFFLGDRMPLGCLDAADSNDDGDVDLSDAAYLLSYLFLQGPRPGPKDLFTSCWYDMTDDSPDCKDFAACNVGVYFCIDKSGSFLGNMDVMQFIKEEVPKSIYQLSESDQFGIIFYEMSMMKFPTSQEPAYATEEMKMEYVLTTLAERNTNGIPIYTIGIFSSFDDFGEDWLRAIAEQNHGAYARIDL